MTALKKALYPHLLPIARTWWDRLGREAPWPDDFDDWLQMCHAAGQTKTTAILLKYGAGDWNALHRDLYGELIFPLQVVINLTDPDVDYTGGEFLLYEQRPRAQSRGTATVIPHGHGLVFTTRDRPTKSVRGWSAAPIRHGGLHRPLRDPVHPGPGLSRRRVKRYALIGADGRPHRSTIPGTIGGHCRSKIYGRLDCPPPPHCAP